MVKFAFAVYCGGRDFVGLPLVGGGVAGVIIIYVFVFIYIHSVTVSRNRLYYIVRYCYYDVIVINSGRAGSK